MAKQTQSKLLTFMLCLAVLSFRDLAVGAEKPKSPESEHAFEDSVIKHNQRIAEFFDSYAEGIDLWLSGKKVSKRENETRVRLENSTYFKERQDPNNTTNVNVQLRLPNVEDYWQLKFTSYDEAEERRIRNRGYLRQTPRERNYGASVGALRRFGKVRAAFNPRLGLQNPLNISHSLEFESVAEMDKYEINPKLEFFANPEKGTGFYLGLNFNFELSSRWSLTFINDGEYEEKRNMFSASNGVSFTESYSDTASLAYSLMFESHNRLNYHLESYTFSIAWSQAIFEKIIEYQMIPYLAFVKPGFRAEPGFVFNLNFNF